ncbi:PREDICTED: RDM1 [Prunus dulcis]|uniref:PREDICTED: RDM1 n=1 Tax=Prunus dulcis TaxID=3755 RepID=A0A5E4FYH3_PRUDU|nr:hypothetical protein L3X38_012703 [Prunus dulcis]VVA32519.1 PREDICTED: RDM1 [Prunus dulcis]
MKRAFPWDEQVDVISSDDSSSSDMEMETNIESDSKQLTNNTTSDQPAKERTSEAVERFAHEDKGDFATSLKHFRVKTSTEE